MVKEEYNNIPVHVCAYCNSLHIKYIDDTKTSVYCVECGFTDTMRMHINDYLNIKNK